MSKYQENLYQYKRTTKLQSRSISDRPVSQLRGLSLLKTASIDHQSEPRSEGSSREAVFIYSVRRAYCQDNCQFALDGKLHSGCILLLNASIAYVIASTD